MDQSVGVYLGTLQLRNTNDPAEALGLPPGGGEFEGPVREFMAPLMTCQKFAVGEEIYKLWADPTKPTHLKIFLTFALGKMVQGRSGLKGLAHFTKLQCHAERMIKGDNAR